MTIKCKECGMVFTLEPEDIVMAGRVQMTCTACIEKRGDEERITFPATGRYRITGSFPPNPHPKVETERDRQEALDREDDESAEEGWPGDV